jgi:hypothetical protein
MSSAEERTAQHRQSENHEQSMPILDLLDVGDGGDY